MSSIQNYDDIRHRYLSAKTKDELIDIISRYRELVQKMIDEEVSV